MKAFKTRTPPTNFRTAKGQGLFARDGKYIIILCDKGQECVPDGINVIPDTEILIDDQFGWVIFKYEVEGWSEENNGD